MYNYVNIGQGPSQELLLGRVSLRAWQVGFHNLGAKRRYLCATGVPYFCEIGGPRAILAIENTNKYVAINTSICSFAEIYENLN